MKILGIFNRKRHLVGDLLNKPELSFHQMNVIFEDKGDGAELREGCAERKRVGGLPVHAEEHFRVHWVNRSMFVHAETERALLPHRYLGGHRR